jgi:hypothetical protein
MERAQSTPSCRKCSIRERAALYCVVRIPRYLPLRVWPTEAVTDDQLLLLSSCCPTAIPYVTRTAPRTLVAQLSFILYFLQCCPLSTVNLPFRRPFMRILPSSLDYFLLSFARALFKSDSKPVRWLLVDSHSQFHGSASNAARTRIRAIVRSWDRRSALASLSSSPYVRISLLSQLTGS